MGNQNNNRNNNRNKKTSLVSRIIGITVGTLVIAAALWALAFANRIKPPEIYPDAGIVEGSTDITPAEGLDEQAEEGEAEDLLIGNGLHAPEGFSADDRKEQFYTFLIVGLDIDGVQTDTIMVASYDGVNKTGSVVGVPRDSLVNVSRNTKKINSAYQVGMRNGGGREGGINQLKREIKTIIGFMPDFYVCVDMNAFEKIVDAVGGIDIEVPGDMIYDDPYQNLHTNIKKGMQHLNGEEALKFARYRLGNTSAATITDYQRIKNQQAVINAVLDKLLEPANILKIPEFIRIFNECVYSDITLENMMWFADQLNKISDADALTMHTIPTTGTSGKPSYYEYLDAPAIVELVNMTINPYKKDIELKDLDIITNIH